MSGKKKSRPSRRATEKEASSIAAGSAAMEVDHAATAGLSSGCESGDDVFSSLTDEERDMMKKVDFSVLQRDLPQASVLDDGSIRLLGKEDLEEYAVRITALLLVYVKQHRDVARELGNAMELIMNDRVTMFGRSSQRSSSILGKGAGASAGEGSGTKEDHAGEPPAGAPAGDARPEDGASSGSPCGEGEGAAPQSTGTAGEDTGSQDAADAGKTEKKRRPRRRTGCARKVYEKATVVDIDCDIPKEKLDAIYGEGGWKEMPSAFRDVTEYRVIPAAIVVKVYHLHAYSAADCTDPESPGIIRAENPLSGKRARKKSPVAGSMIADILHMRGSLRVPVFRICRHYHSMGLALTPQRVYENIRHYSKLFSYLIERLWSELLRCRYIQVDETPVRYYDRNSKKQRRGYLWVFTTSEMLIDGRPLTLFHYAEGRGAEVLRRCLKDRGFEGVVGSDALSSYHVLARESEGKIVNAGCLDHFRKRLVMALRAVPGLDQMTEEERRGIPAYVIWTRLNAVFMLDRKTKELQTKEERDAYRDTAVRGAFEELSASVKGTDKEGCPEGSYLSSAITYFENQEVYLKEFLDDSNIASNNSKSERKFVFFSILRNQIKMFGSSGGAEDAAVLESLEQTAREYMGNTRLYYQYLVDKYCPFVQEQDDKEAVSGLEEMDDFLPWSPKWKDYEKELKEKEKILASAAVNF